MKKLTVLAFALILIVPTFVHADTFTLRIGYYLPQTSTNPDSLWKIEFDQMTFKRENFNYTIYGGGYEFFVTKQISLALSIDTYSRDMPGDYLNYEGLTVDQGDYAFSTIDNIVTGGFGVRHLFRVSITPLQLDVRLTPFGRKSRVIPFIGGGVGLYFWRVAVQGETIDFSNPATNLTIDATPVDATGFPVTVSDARESGTSIGGHAFAGIRVPVGFRVTIEAEARYHWAKATFEKAFQGFAPFELGGLGLSVGFNYWF